MKEKIKEMAEKTITEYIYYQIKGYIEIIFQEIIHKENLTLCYDGLEGSCALTVYIADEELKDEFGEYADACEIYHIHQDDLLYVMTHLDKEMDHIAKHIEEYINYKKQNQ